MTFLLNSPQSADCVIKVRATEIKVHKNILASRSKVFDSILMNEQCESNSNIIEINGFPLKVVKEMINYLYSGKSPNMDKMAFLMLKIAEKYKLKQLKLMAEKSLIHSLSIGNACDHLLFSERHSCKILKEWCLRFIYLNAEKVFNTEKWKVVLNDHPLLVAELFNIAVGIN
uniref:BTB domain-containing protein n=1 Tax=Strongyloides papillosus TaxID=174720 RepID=A0A0N5C1Y9_STREA